MCVRHVLLAASLTLAGCGGGPGPNQTLDNYGRALKNHDFGAAYDLMSASFRAKVSRDDYVRMMRDNRLGDSVRAGAFSRFVHEILSARR